MNGWERLGVVIAGLIAIPSTFVGYDSNSRAYVYYDVPKEVQLLQGQIWVDKVYWQARSENRELRACILPTTHVEASGYPVGTAATITCDRQGWNIIFDSIPYLATPFAVVFGIGHILAWVRRGFRKKA